MKWFFAFFTLLVLAGGAGLFLYRPELIEQVENIGFVREGLSSVKAQWFSPEQGASVPFRLAEVKRGKIFSHIMTTGTVNPVSAVTVSTQVSGTIKDLDVDVTTKVKAGDVIARLDPDLFRAEVLQAEAKLERAQANLAKEKAGVKMQKARIEASIAGTRASLENLEEKHRRNKDLLRRNLVSKDEYESIRADFELAAARFREESARLDEIDVKQATIASIQAEVKQAQAELQLAKVKLDRSVIRAPISGVVIEKEVEEGQTVAASLSSPPLVRIADLTEMKVDAWVDEADIGQVRVGQDVEFQVDSYPHRVFSGEVVRIFPSPEIKNNVVTYITEIRVSNHDLALKPGMTANVTIILATKDEVLIAPNIALRIGSDAIRSVYPAIRSAPGQEHRRGREERRQHTVNRKGTVWVYRENGPSRADIHFGATDAKNMEILDGLEEGDKVIVGIKS